MVLFLLIKARSFEAVSILFFVIKLDGQSSRVMVDGSFSIKRDRACGIEKESKTDLEIY